jgi:hypothetical protein
MVQNEKKKGSVSCLPRAKARKRFLMSSRALRLRQKASLTLLLIRQASTTTRRDISSGTIISTWRRRTIRREVKLPFEV